MTYLPEKNKSDKKDFSLRVLKYASIFFVTEIVLAFFAGLIDQNYDVFTFPSLGVAIGISLFVSSIIASIQSYVLPKRRNKIHSVLEKEMQAVLIQDQIWTIKLNGFDLIMTCDITLNDESYSENFAFYIDPSMIDSLPDSHEKRFSNYTRMMGKKLYKIHECQNIWGLRYTLRKAIKTLEKKLGTKRLDFDEQLP